MATHHLKTWKAPFEALLDGRKKFEWRYNDRNFAVGDSLLLGEVMTPDMKFTGRYIKATVSYMLKGPDFFIPVNYCIMGLQDIIEILTSTTE